MSTPSIGSQPATPTVAEEWRPVPGYPGYRVSNTGKVQSCIRRGNRPRLTDEWRPRRLGRGRHGYKVVSLWRGCKGKVFSVHRLVLLAFIGPAPAGCQACHYDNNPANNHLSNLRWDTHAGNHADRERHGTILRGEQVGTSRLTAAVIREVRALYERGVTQVAIARQFGIPQPYVSSIVRRACWKHLP